MRTWHTSRLEEILPATKLLKATIQQNLHQLVGNPSTRGHQNDVCTKEAAGNHYSTAVIL